MNQCLGELLQPETNRVKAAEAALKPYLKNPLCLGGLLQQVQSNPNPGVRQIAAVILRKRVMGHWGKLDPGSQATVQQALLAILQGESERPCRRAVVTVACAVASKCFANPATRWMSLLEFVNACCAAPQEEAREMGYMVLEHLAETIATHMEEAAASLVSVLAAGLGAQEPRVQAGALRATGRLMAETSSRGDTVLHFADLIPPMLQVLAARCASGDEDVVSEVLEVFDELGQAPVPVLNKHVPALVAFLLEMIKADGLEGGTRGQAANVLGTLSEYKPKLLGKKGLVPSILEAMMHLMAASEESAAGSLHLALDDNEHDPAEGAGAGGDDDDDEDDEDDDDDGDKASPCQMAQATIDKLGNTLPMKYIWEPALAASMQCLGTGESKWRKAACATLGNLAEGCQDPMREALEVTLPQILLAAQDPNQHAREAACFCLGQMAEHCQPEIMRYQGNVLPVVFGLLDDPLQSVQGISCYVLEEFSEHLSVDNVVPLLPQLAAKLLQLTQSPRLSIREMALSALSSTAVAAEEHFAPYAQATMEVLMGPLQAGEERLWTLRGRALECLGHMAVGIGKDLFQPFLSLGMASAEQSLQLDAPELHEFTYSFFGTVAKVIGTDFAPFMPALVPHLCRVVTRRDGTEVDFDPSELGGVGAGVGNDDEDDEDDEEGGFRYMQIRTADLDSKRTAAIAVGMIAENTGSAFAAGGFLQPALQALLAQRNYFHDKVRREVATAMGRCVKAAAAGCFGSVEAVPPYTPGDWATTLEMKDPSGLLARVTSTVMRGLVGYMLEDSDKQVVAVACEGVQSVLDLLGPASLVSVMAPGWLLPEDEQEGGGGQAGAGAQQQQIAAAEGAEPKMLTVLQAVLQLLYEKAPSQMTVEELAASQVEGDERAKAARAAAAAAEAAGDGSGAGGDDDEDDEDHDNELIDNVADLVGMLAKAMGPGFADVSAQYFDAMMKFAKASRPSSDRAMAIGCFAEMLQYMGPASGAQHVSQVMAAVEAGLRDGAPSVQRNSAFCAGILAQTSPEAMAPHFPMFLERMQPCFSVTHEADHALQDNACSAVARFMLVSATHVPMEQVLPVFLASLPLKADFSENENVYGCLAYLLEAKHPVLCGTACLGPCLLGCAHGLQASEVTDETKARLVQGLKALAADAAAAMGAAFATVPPEAAAFLQQAMAM